PVTPKATAARSAATAGTLIRPVSSHDGTRVSGREIRKRRGRRKWSTAMITVAHGTVIARNVANLNQPLTKWKLTRSAAITPPPATIRHVNGRRQYFQPPTRF